MRSFCLLVVFGLAALAEFGIGLKPEGYSESALKDWVDWKSLPGSEEIVGKASFHTFTGYIPVDPKSGKNYFYWFFESATNASSSPVVFWTNGGPGCSGLLGLFTELGPIRPDKNGRLMLNPYAWNQNANLLFIEQPTGVGFSYSSSLSDYSLGDEQAAKDMYTFLQTWFDRFHQYRNNDFHLASESYGGHYLPTLAWEIVQRNKASGDKPRIPLKGFAVGNPYTDAFSNNVATYQKFWGNQLLPKTVYDPWNDRCTTEESRAAHSHFCDKTEAKMEALIGNLNPYALDYPICVDDLPGSRGAQAVWLRRHIRKDRKSLQTNYDPCATNYLSAYLNRADVKRAIHARKDLKWTECSSLLNYNSTDLDQPMQKYYSDLLKGDFNLKILVFSGDDDSVCATVGTQAWIYDLGIPVVSSWQPWYVEKQTAGFVTRFDKDFTFVTVHDAGHEVPAYQPERALVLFHKYLNGDWFA